jgi:hypothetical protein
MQAASGLFVKHGSEWAKSIEVQQLLDELERETGHEAQLRKIAARE